MPRKATKEAEPQPAAAAQKETTPAPAAAPAMTEAEVEELPKAIVRRLVKDKLAHIAGGGEGAEVIVNKDAMAAFAESARIFIHYLSATSVTPHIPTSVHCVRIQIAPD
jgi:DNA polymerase epsilon subunit 3